MHKFSTGITAPAPVVRTTCPAMNKVFEAARAVACTKSTVLLTGETGTGKEMFALAIHKNSNRESKSFVVVDCAALPRELVESMLFGHDAIQIGYPVGGMIEDTAFVGNPGHFP
mgnify:CR=1 FL=1